MWTFHSKGNRGIYKSGKLLVDHTPPPLEDLMYPRIYPWRHENTSADGIRWFFIKNHTVQPAWNTLRSKNPGQKDWEAVIDPESGDTVTYWTLSRVSDGGVLQVIVDRRKQHGGQSSYGDIALDPLLKDPLHPDYYSAALVLGAAYQIKLESRNKAGLMGVARSELMVADWTPPNVTTPLLSSGSKLSDVVVPRWYQPPGSSSYGGGRQLIAEIVCI